MARLIIIEDNHELASLIASAIRSRGHSALSAHTGQAALEALELGGVDAAVVDLLLPDMDGSQVLLHLKSRSLPAIAVSGVFKGHQFAVEATEVHGAVAFFEKPFEMNALLDKIDQLVGVPARPPDEADEDTLEELSPIDEEQLDDISLIQDNGHGAFILPPPRSEEVTRPPPPPPSDAQEDEPLTFHPSEPPASDSMAEQLTPVWKPPEEWAKQLAEPPPPPPPPPLAEAASIATPAAPEGATVAPEGETAVAPEAAPPGDEEASAPAEGASSGEPALKVVLPFGDREKVWTKPATLEQRRAAAPQSEQAGDLRTSSVPRLLTAYYQARHSGELKLRQGNVVKVVYFEKGQPIYAASNLAQERFGRFCVRKGVLSAAQLEEVAALVKAQGLRTAEGMMRVGLLTGPLRKKLLEEQVREIIWSTFGWTHGEYSFVPKKPGGSGLVSLSVFPGDLILEGVQRTETLVSLRQKMPAQRRYGPTADPPYELHQLSLSGGQALLLAYADGSKTVEDLLTLMDLSEKDALATLVGLELLGLLVERRHEDKSRRISFGL